MPSFEDTVPVSIAGPRKRKLAARAGQHNDRFIPNRADMDLDKAEQYWDENNLNTANRGEHRMEETQSSPSKLTYVEHLKQELGLNKKPKLLSFRNRGPVKKYNPLAGIVQEECKPIKTKDYRHIPTNAMRVLDAPDLTNDFYLNPIHWGFDNILSVALGNAVYLWHSDKGEIQELCQTAEEENLVTSVRFSDTDHDKIGIGTDHMDAYLYSVSTEKKIRTLRGHQDRVSALEWNGMTLATASKDSQILLHDVRVKKHVIRSLDFHNSEVCSLAWDYSGTKLAAGGTDNLVSIYDMRANRLQHKLTGHKGAVKGLSWNPHRPNVLASGGGITDRTVKLWNSSSGKLLSSHQVGGQVSSIIFNGYENEVVATVGDKVNLYTYVILLRYLAWLAICYNVCIGILT